MKTKILYRRDWMMKVADEVLDRHKNGIQEDNEMNVPVAKCNEIAKLLRF
jgi:hypothetical protein